MSGVASLSFYLRSVSGLRCQLSPKTTLPTQCSGRSPGHHAWQTLALPTNATAGDTRQEIVILIVHCLYRWVPRFTLSLVAVCVCVKSNCVLIRGRLRGKSKKSSLAGGDTPAKRSQSGTTCRYDNLDMSTLSSYTRVEKSQFRYNWQMKTEILRCSGMYKIEITVFGTCSDYCKQSI